MSNLEFIWIIAKAFWPLTILAVISWIVIMADILHKLRNRKGVKYVFRVQR